MRHVVLAVRLFAAPVLAADPPAVSREFRGVGVATVANIDWPSQPGPPAVVPIGDERAVFLLAQRTATRFVARCHKGDGWVTKVVPSATSPTAPSTSGSRWPGG